MWKTGKSLVPLFALALTGCALDYGDVDRAIDNDPIEYDEQEARCGNPEPDLTHPDPPPPLLPYRPPANVWTAIGQAPEALPWLHDVAEAYAAADLLVTAGAPLSAEEVDRLVEADALLEDALDGRYERALERELDVLVGLEDLVVDLRHRLPCVEEVEHEPAY